MERRLTATIVAACALLCALQLWIGGGASIYQDSYTYFQAWEDLKLIHPNQWRPPVYPILVGGLTELIGLSAAMAILLVVQWGAFAGALMLLYKICRRIGIGQRISGIGVLAVFLFPGMWVLNNLAMAESLCASSVILLIYLTIRFIDTKQKKWLYSSGGMLWLLVFTKPVFIILIPIWGILWLGSTISSRKNIWKAAAILTVIAGSVAFYGWQMYRFNGGNFGLTRATVDNQYYCLRQDGLIRPEEIPVDSIRNRFIPFYEADKGVHAPGYNLYTPELAEFSWSEKRLMAEIALRNHRRVAIAGSFERVKESATFSQTFYPEPQEWSWFGIFVVAPPDAKPFLFPFSKWLYTPIWLSWLIAIGFLTMSIRRWWKSRTCPVIPLLIGVTLLTGMSVSIIGAQDAWGRLLTPFTLLLVPATLLLLQTIKAKLLSVKSRFPGMMPPGVMAAIIGCAAVLCSIQMAVGGGACDTGDGSSYFGAWFGMICHLRPDGWRTPVYSIICGVSQELFGFSAAIKIVLILNWLMFVGTLNILWNLNYHLGVSKRWNIAAMACFFIFPAGWIMCSFTQPEVLCGLGIATLIKLTTLYAKSRKLNQLIAISAVIFLLVFSKPVFLFLIPIYLWLGGWSVWRWRVRLKSTGLCALLIVGSALFYQWQMWRFYQLPVMSMSQSLNSYIILRQDGLIHPEDIHTDSIRVRFEPYYAQDHGMWHEENWFSYIPESLEFSSQEKYAMAKDAASAHPAGVAMGVLTRFGHAATDGMAYYMAPEDLASLRGAVFEFSEDVHLFYPRIKWMDLPLWVSWVIVMLFAVRCLTRRDRRLLPWLMIATYAGLTVSSVAGAMNDWGRLVWPVSILVPGMGAYLLTSFAPRIFCKLAKN